MPYRFSPPTAPLVPPTVRVNHPGHALFRHYAPWQAGINVFLLKDGTVTTVEPGDPELIDTTFHGGHIHTVEDEVADLLVDAGYTVQFVTVELPAPGLPSGDYTSPPVVTPPDTADGAFLASDFEASDFEVGGTSDTSLLAFADADFDIDSFA